MIAAARSSAYRVLQAVAAARSDLPSALASQRRQMSDERDRALAGEIAIGTLRWQGAFDHLIAAFSRRPVARLDPEVVTILRLSLFQLLHLDRVPAAAVVDDAVQMAKREGKGSAAGFVNALLRRASRERGRLPFPQRPADDRNQEAALDYLSITLSHPRWLVARWLDRWGLESAAAWAAFNNDHAPLALRANRLRLERDELADRLRAGGVIAAPGRFSEDTLVTESGNPLQTPLAQQGLFFVQDEASQLVASVVGARTGERILDACASPGGKTTQMAADMGNRGAIVAVDVRDRRIALLRQSVRASGASCVHIVQADAGQLPFGPSFDAVLLDAPCSGLGTIRRDPDVRWRRHESDLAPLAAGQRRLLAEAAASVRPGGRLVYATCSSEPEENEQVVDAFLAEAGGFRRAEEHPLSRRPETAGLLDGRGDLRTLPFRDGLEAFYAAILVKTKGLR